VFQVATASNNGVESRIADALAATPRAAQWYRIIERSLRAIRRWQPAAPPDQHGRVKCVPSADPRDTPAPTGPGAPKLPELAGPAGV